MSFLILTGAMFSNKTAKLIEHANRLELREKKYKIFYPSKCSNGISESISSRTGATKHAVALNNILDIYDYVDGLEYILIDEAQFLCVNEDEINDLIMLIKYAEKSGINIIASMLDLDYRNYPFVVFKELAPYADDIIKLKAVCSECKDDNARTSARFRNGMPASMEEDLLVEKSSDNVEYRPLCNKCYYKLVKSVI